MSDLEDTDREREYDGRGYEQDYEPGEDEVSSFTWAKLNLLYEADYVAFGTHDNPPHHKSDQALFIFDHPDYEGGLCVPIRLGELGVYRAVRRTRPERQGRGYWTMVEDVGIFEDLPDWVNHTPLERDGNEDTGSDRAPTVYLRDGTPVKPRLIGAECVGEVAGEAAYGYTRPEEPENPTLVFVNAGVSDDKVHICPTCWRAFHSERAWAEHYLDAHPWMYQLARIIHGAKRRIRRVLRMGSSRSGGES